MRITEDGGTVVDLYIAVEESEMYDACDTHQCSACEQLRSCKPLYSQVGELFSFSF